MELPEAGTASSQKTVCVLFFSYHVDWSQGTWGDGPTGLGPGETVPADMEGGAAGASSAPSGLTLPLFPPGQTALSPAHTPSWPRVPCLDVCAADLSADRQSPLLPPASSSHHPALSPVVTSTFMGGKWHRSISESDLPDDKVEP